ncbi:MAG: GDSL-type esterase/lipase family protein [Candidatus Competibacter sp.]|nr:GDSL-type esterase/lipase family protein [Candidatus Competibacter sp.]MDG4583309.1 GDSL-type esterase/lipase family protein [Candidatus Competibacter sp.]
MAFIDSSLTPAFWRRLSQRWPPRMPALILIAAVFLSALSFWQLQTDHWEAAIRAFETEDRLRPPQPGRVVFVGSSSIRFWHTLAADMAPIPVLNRGFGGSRLHDILRYSDRIILPYQPRAVVVYGGENDLGGRWSRPETVLERFQRLVEHLRQTDPALPILLLAIKPSPYYQQRLSQQVEANQRLRAYCEATPGLRFIDVASPLLGADGRPRPELFQDGLHLNAAGYRLWRERVRPALLAALDLNSESAGSGTAPAAGAAPKPLPSSAPAPRVNSLPPSP